MPNARARAEAEGVEGRGSKGKLARRNGRACTRGCKVKVAEAKDAEPWSSRPIIEMLHKGCGWTLAKGGATAKKPVAWAVQQKYYDAPHVAFGRSGVRARLCLSLLRAHEAAVS